jgi:hypothetical protein
MARTRNSDPTPPSPSDPAEPARAFAATQALRDALPADRVTAVPLELRASLDAARSLAAALAAPEVTDRFARIPRDLLDPAHLAAFADAITAFEHARTELDAAVNARGEVTLPEALATDAHALRTRMLKVVIHYFEDDDALAAEVKALGRKKGHAPMAADLRKLAEIYDAQRTVVERDPKYWREGDAAEARTAATAVETLLEAARGEAERTWGEAVQRAWTLLATLHDELRLTAWWLFRSEDGAERFPAMPAPPRKRGPRVKPGAGDAA